MGYRIVVVDSAAYLQHKEWMQTGWNVLCEAAPFERDYMLPTPTSNLRGCKCAELQYHTACAIQSQVIAHSTYSGWRIFTSATQHYFTPHSGRNYLSSAAAVLNFTKSERDVLGEWSSEGSERYARVAKHRISAVQRAVSKALHNLDDPDPLAEADTIEGLDSFLQLQGVPAAERAQTMRMLCSRNFAEYREAEFPAPPRVRR